VLAVSEISAAPVIAVMAFGVLVTLVGHVLKLRYIVATGLALLFLATAAMLIGGYAAYDDDPADPRPETRSER
jgi:type IV secretory pathway TrbD component